MCSRSRERSLILLVLATFGFVCFGAIFFLPGANEIPSSQNKVCKIYMKPFTVTASLQTDIMCG